jgi:cytoskeletal protein RodZ
MAEDFGSYLKHQRELRGIPLDEIAQTTKISIRFLQALEANQFDELPGEVFIKGFIRSYGQAIGSNVD